PPRNLRRDAAAPDDWRFFAMRMLIFVSCFICNLILNNYLYMLQTATTWSFIRTQCFLVKNIQLSVRTQGFIGPARCRAQDLRKRAHGLLPQSRGMNPKQNALVIQAV